MKKPEIKHNRKMTNHEVLVLYHGLKSLKGVSGLKLVYAINRTMRYLKPLAEAFAQEALIPMPVDFKNYQEELKEFYKKSVTTADGTPRIKVDVLPDGQTMERYDVDFNDRIVVAEKAKIDAKYAAVITAYQAEVNEYNNFLDQECEEEIKLHYVPLKYAPEDKEQYDIVAPLIKEMPVEMQEKWDALFDGFKEE